MKEIIKWILIFTLFQSCNHQNKANLYSGNQSQLYSGSANKLGEQNDNDASDIEQAEYEGNQILNGLHISTNLNNQMYAPGLSDRSSCATSTYGYVSNDESFVNSKDPFNLATGAQKVMAAYYQSCETLKVGRGIPRKKSNTTPQALIKHLKRSGKYPTSQCRDRSRSNLGYGYGSSFPYSGGKLNVMRSKVDCSAFVSTALAAAGLKWSKSQSSGQAVKITSNIDQMRKSSCMETPFLDENNSLKKGDIINSSNDHVVIIDGVGSDPMGIKKIKRKSDCTSLNRGHLDFTIIHSSKFRGQNGIHRMHISTYYDNRIVVGVLKNARLACRAKFENRSVRAQRFRVRQKNENRGPRYVTIQRHKGRKEPGCTFMQPIPVKSQSCIKSCFKKKGNS